MTPARLALAASIFPIMISGHAFAGGYALNEMSAASVGNAHAGAATAQDASTVFYNPAAMTRLSGRHFTVVGSAIRTSAQFGNAGSLTATGAPLTGHSAWDFGYAYLLTRDASINKAEPSVGGTLIGSYDSDANILSVQYSHAI